MIPCAPSAEAFIVRRGGKSETSPDIMDIHVASLVREILYELGGVDVLPHRKFGWISGLRLFRLLASAICHIRLSPADIGLP